MISISSPDSASQGAARAGVFGSGLAGNALAFLVIASMTAGLTFAVMGEPLLAIAAMLVLPACAAICRWPDAAVPFVAFILYTNAAVVAVHFHGVPYAVAAAFPLLLLIPIARDVIFRNQRVVVTRNMAWILAFFLVQFVGAMFSARPEKALGECAKTVLEGGVLYVLLVNAIRSPQQVKHAVRALLAAGAFMGAITLSQQLTQTYEDPWFGFGQLSSHEDRERGETRIGGFQTGEISIDGAVRQPRLSGPIGEKNRFAQIMAMLVPLGIFQLMGKRRRSSHRLLTFAALVLTGVGCSLAFSRGAAVGLGLMFLVMIALGYVRGRHIFLVFAGGAIVAAIVPQYAVRLATIFDAASAATGGGVHLMTADGATRGRVTEMKAGALLFADHPLIGVGPKMYGHHYNEYARLAGGKVVQGTRQPHSLMVGIPAEHGLLGTIAFSGILVIAFRDLARARRRWRGLRPDLAHTATALILVLVVYLSTSIFLHAAYVRYFWFMLGLAGAVSCLVAPEERSGLATLVRLTQRYQRGGLQLRPTNPSAPQSDATPSS